MTATVAMITCCPIAVSAPASPGLWITLFLPRPFLPLGGKPWMWTVLYGYHEDHTPTHGYEPRGAAMGAFAKSWRRE
jgi:hypothetical protein